MDAHDIHKRGSIEGSLLALVHYFLLIDTERSNDSSFPAEEKHWALEIKISMGEMDFHHLDVKRPYTAK